MKAGAASRDVAVYGAYGHTGRFVVAELRRRGWRPVHVGRDLDRLSSTSAEADETFYQASVDDPAALDAALNGCVAVLNCAGPFDDTAIPVIDAALRASVPYFDTSGETEVAAHIVAAKHNAAATAGVVIMPSIGFYGALGDLLATLAAGDWLEADTIVIGLALSGWSPTKGTRDVMARMGGRRMLWRDGKLIILTDLPRLTQREFPDPIGMLAVVPDHPGPEAVLIPRHMRVKDIEIFMAAAAVKDLRDPNVSAPVPADDSGRSSQVFHVHVTVRRNGTERTSWAAGRDIYASTAPILVEAMERVLAGDVPPGVRAPGEVFDPGLFLRHVAAVDGFMQVSAS